MRGSSFIKNAYLKIIIALIVVMAASVLLSSCNTAGDPDNGAVPTPDPTAAPAETPTADPEPGTSETEPGNTADAVAPSKAPADDTSDQPADETKEIKAFDPATDMQLGLIAAGMEKSELEKVMTAELSESEKKTEYGMETEYLTYSDGTFIHILEGEIYSITVTSDEYATPRGLKTGDTVETLKSLYGEPTAVEENQWIYSAGGYDLFFVTVENGIVVKIMVSQVL